MRVQKNAIHVNSARRARNTHTRQGAQGPSRKMRESACCACLCFLLCERARVWLCKGQRGRRGGHGARRGKHRAARRRRRLSAKARVQLLLLWRASRVRRKKGRQGPPPPRRAQKEAESGERERERARASLCLSPHKTQLMRGSRAQPTRRGTTRASRAINTTHYIRRPNACIQQHPSKTYY